jgi:Domain of unknown function (DUF4118)
MASQTESELGGPVWAAVGTLAAITAAGVMSRARATFGQEIVLLVLVVIIVGVAAAGGKVAGIYTAVVASLSFNFWHTKPYLSLRIHSARDVVSTILLFVVGLVVGELAASRERVRRDRFDDEEMLRGLAIQGDLLARGASPEEVWSVTHQLLVRALDLGECRFEAFGTRAPGLPRIESRIGPRPTVMKFLGGGFALPPEGAELAVEHDGEMMGRIVCMPGEQRHGVSLIRRRFALTAAEQFAVSVWSSGRRPQQLTAD